MENNINFKIKQIELTIDSILENLPVGIAYLILKTKTQELQGLYNSQVLKEAEEVKLAQQQQEQEQKEETE